MPHDPSDTNCLATAAATPATSTDPHPVAGLGAVSSTGRRDRMPKPPSNRPHPEGSSKDPSTLRPSSRTLRRASRMALLFAGLLGSAVAQADPIPVNPPPPQLLEYASETPSVLSRAFATTTFVGSLQVRQGCAGENSQAWACRILVDQRDSLAAGNYVSQSTNTQRTTASASRGDTAFDNKDGFADYQVPVANSRAQSDFGSNKAEALARFAGDWNETRVLSTNDSTQRKEEDFFGRAAAGATSVWADAFTALTGGTVRFVFSVTQHQATVYEGLFHLADGERREGDGFGEYLVQLLDLRSPVTYGDGERFPFQDGFALLAEASLGFDTGSPNGKQFLSLEFDAVADGLYSLVSLLSVEVVDNALLDLFGTASLERIEVGEGQQLAFASGTAYNFVFPDGEPQDPGTVPEPATLALLLCASVAMGTAHRRRSLRGRGHA